MNEDDSKKRKEINIKVFKFLENALHDKQDAISGIYPDFFIKSQKIEHPHYDTKFQIVITGLDPKYFNKPILEIQIYTDYEQLYQKAKEANITPEDLIIEFLKDNTIDIGEIDYSMAHYTPKQRKTCLFNEMMEEIYKN